jgi:hypothetical protein
MAIGKWIARRAHYWSGLRIQISNRIEDRLGEFVQLFPLQSPIEHLTYIAAVPPKVDIVLIVGQGVLDMCESKTRVRGVVGEGRTRIVVKRVLAEPRAI